MRPVRSRPNLFGLEDRRTPANFVVTNAADDGLGSFRQAILNANSSAGPDTITFDPAFFATPRTIVLVSELPTVTDDVTIVGTGPDKVRVERGSSAGNFRVLTVENPSRQLNVQLTGFTLANGNLVVVPNTQNPSLTQVQNGGGLYISDESVTLTRMTVTKNQSNQQGGGVASGPGGVLTIVESTISNNVATGQVGGSPLFQYSGVGGGIYFTYDGSLTLISSAVTGNVAKQRGGGVYLYGEVYGKAVIRNSTISGNVTQQSSLLPPPFLPVSGGGGVSVNTNAATGGKFQLTVQNSTIVNNSTAGGSNGGGLLLTNGVTTRVESTIVSGNTAGSGPDISAASGLKVTVDFSAIGSTGGFTLTAGPGGAGSNKLGQNLLLGPLADNGGPTKTHLPGPGSPVVDAGSNPSGVAFDQRGLTRYYDDPLVPGIHATDIGAVELQPPGLPTAAAVAPNVISGGGTSYQVKVTYTDDDGLNAASFGTNDIQVLGPNGYKATPTAFAVDVPGNGSPRTVTYTLTPPGGSWDLADLGQYSIVVQANSVFDLVNNAVPAGPVGGFSVAIPRVLVVTNANDSGPGSLRQAILDANAVGPSVDTITFDKSAFSFPQTIFLDSGVMRVTDSVVIQGPGLSLATIDGNFTTRHLVLDGPGQIDVQIFDLSFNNGRTANNFFSERGASIHVGNESLFLERVNFNGNIASKAYGGAIYVGGGGSVTAIGCRFAGNQSPSKTGGGGAIASLEPGHVITLIDCKMVGNTGGLYGGAVASINGGTLIVDRTSFLSNSTTQTIDNTDLNKAAPFGGGAITVGGRVTAEQKSNPATLVLTNSTLEGNLTVGYGGGVMFVAPTPGSLIRNVTIYGNTAKTTTDGAAGGLFLGGLENTPFSVENTTIANNGAYSGGGLFVANNEGQSVWFRSTILAGNKNADPSQLPVDIDGQINAERSLIGVLDGGVLLLDIDNIYGNAGSPVDAGLDPAGLANNGGPTRTVALLPTSPAIDAGSNPAALAFDQRGPGFDRVRGLAADVGAFELQVASPPRVTQVQIDGGSAQRSNVRSITVTFSTAVTLPANPAEAFQVYRSGPGLPLDTAVLGVDLSASSPTQTVAKLTFSGGLTQGGSLIDGRYELTVFAAKVQADGFNLDGNGDGIAGDNATALFHRLFGDGNGDGSVNFTDFLAFRSAFGSTGGTHPAFDFDGDGNVNFSDFLAFRSRFGTTLAP